MQVYRLCLSNFLYIPKGLFWNIFFFPVISHQLNLANLLWAIGLIFLPYLHVLSLIHIEKSSGLY